MIISDSGSPTTRALMETVVCSCRLMGANPEIDALETSNIDQVQVRTLTRIRDHVPLETGTLMKKVRLPAMS